MAVESKVIVTAEDRTAAAFAAIERNTGKTALAMLKLEGQMLKLAGIGSLVAFFRTGAQSTEKWRDEMARLDDITEKFFNQSADAGRLDPFIQAIKMAYTLAFGAGVAIENMGLAIGSLAAAAEQASRFNFAEASRIIELSNQDMARNVEAFQKMREEINRSAPAGFAAERTQRTETDKSNTDSGKKLDNDASGAVADLERRTALLGKETQAEQLLFEVQQGRFQFLDQANKDALVAAARRFDAAKALADFEQASRADLEKQIESEEKFNEKRAQEAQKETERAAQQDVLQRERLNRSIEMINESFMTEQELLIQQYESRQMIIDDAFVREMISAEAHTRLKEDLELQHQAKMGDIDAQGTLERRRFAEMNTKQQVQNVLGTLLQLTRGVAANSKSMFQINKIAGIANAIINTSQGVTKALSAYPPPLSFVMAAAQFAAGMAQVQQIKSAQFGSSTSAPSVGGGTAIPTTNITDIPDISPQRPAPKPTVNLFLSGDTETVSRDWLINKFIPSWNEALGDGANIKVSVT